MVGLQTIDQMIEDAYQKGVRGMLMRNNFIFHLKPKCHFNISTTSPVSIKL